MDLIVNRTAVGSTGPSIREAATEASATGPAARRAASGVPMMEGPIKSGHDRGRSAAAADPCPENAIGRADPSGRRDGPAKPGHAQSGTAPPRPPTDERLPGWLDRIPGADRAQLLAMSPVVRAETLRVWAAFYGFDTS
jgi:hypothetical protein